MMKVNKKLFAKYNKPETVLVISLYPKRGEVYTAGASGVASYSKNVVMNMNRRVVVFAEYTDKPSIYEEGNCLVLRCFKPGNIKMWRVLLAAMKQFNQTKKVLIQFDFSMYGGMLVSGMLLPFLMVLKALNFDSSVVSHHVIMDVTKLSGHVGLGTGFIDKVKAKLYNSIFYFFYLMLGMFTQNIIILEETLRKRLQRVVPKHKVIVIPHAVDTSLRQVEKAYARKKLGIHTREKVVMFFGFVNWFKGADFFASAFQNVDKLLGENARFIIAGGESATLSTKPYYQNYFFKTMKTIEGSKAVQMTGYVPQEKIKEYFAAADLVVFPYRHFMCASGVLSLVFSYRKPFIVSDQIADMFDADDLYTALTSTNLQKKDLTFSLNKKHLLQRTEKVLRNGLKKKMVNFTNIIREQRSFRKNAQLYDEALFGIEQRVNSRVSWQYA